MEGFESKRALLEHLGKNPDDRKLIKRMIERGEVYEEGGMFYLRDVEEKKEEKKSEVDEVKMEEVVKEMVSNEELERLKRRNDELIEKYGRLAEAYKKMYKERDLFLYEHLKVFYEKFMIWKKLVENKVWYYTASGKFPEGKHTEKEVMGWYRYEEDASLLEEIKFVGDLIKDRGDKIDIPSDLIIPSEGENENDVEVDEKKEEENFELPF